MLSYRIISSFDSAKYTANLGVFNVLGIASSIYCIRSTLSAAWFLMAYILSTSEA